MSDPNAHRIARRVLTAVSFAILPAVLLAIGSHAAQAQGCPQIVVNGAARGTSAGGVVGRAGTGGGGAPASAGVPLGTVQPNTLPCNTPPSIMVTPVSGTTNQAAPKFVIEYCSPNYNIDMSTNRVTMNGVVVDATDGRTMPLMSQNPDTMPNSGFCGVPARSGKTAQEIGRVPLRQGADTLVIDICDDISNCATKTNIYNYTPTWPVVVTPHDSLTRVFSAQADAATFTLHRLDTDTTTGKYALIRTCTGVGVGTCAGADTVTLKGGETKTTNVTFTGGGSISSGRIKLKATLTTNAAMTDSGSDSVIASIPGIVITPDNIALKAALNAHNTAFFTATNTGPIAATYTFQGTCGGADTACVPSTASQSITAGATVPITVGYKSEALSSTGTVTLTGVHISIPTATDVGSYNTTAVTPTTMVTSPPGSLVNVERGLCLTVAAGHGAASECGTLRLAHALPSIRSMNKSRTPTLIYNSAFAHPEAVVPLDVTLPTGMPVPDSVTVTLTINSAVRASGKWTGIDWGYASTRRVVLGFDAINDSSGHYPWIAQASSWYSATRYTSSTTPGSLVIVNRASSNFGAGWWLAGLEKLYTIASDGSKLWIGGDGSSRHFTNIAGVSTAWTDGKLDSPDSLTFDGTYYHHILPHGLTVLFDATGRHVKTINRLKDTTTFFYTGQRLDSLQVPPTPLGKRYIFAYDGASPNRLQSVSAPRLPSRTRLTAVTTSGGRITAIKEPDSTVVGFGYTLGDTNRITSRTDRNGVVGTFAYNAAKMLVRDSIGMDTTGLPIVTNFRPYESVGWAPSSVDTALTYGLIDGPRTDVGDTTLFWLDQFQEPQRIRNALGQDTKLSRGNATYPALVTRMQAPNGRVLLATYDGHGNIATSTDSGTCISGTCATTSYVWDQTWDFVKKVTAPLGEVSLASYDLTYGNKQWQQPDADSAVTTRRVTFHYEGTRHLVDTVQEPLITGIERMWYDAAGNLDSVKTPTNIPTRYYLDSLGRDTLVKSAIDMGDTTWAMSKTTYDVSDEVVFDQSYSFPQSDLSTVLHGRKYDAEGNMVLDSVMVSPDINSIGWVRHSFVYDNANRKRREYPDGSASGYSLFTYDPAGNVVSWTPRGYTANATTYDALNRPVQRVVPSWGTGGLHTYTYGSSFLADTLTYTYDIAGNTTTANNVFAKIARAYNLNGTLAADTERVRESDSASTAYSHVYGVRYGYDLEGRRLWMKHPATLAVTGTDSVGYAYDATTGLLKSVRDPYGNRFAFGYDAALRMASDTLLAGAATPLIESRTYDNESRTLSRHEMLGATSVAFDTMTYDARSKRVSASFSYVDGTGGDEGNTYNKLGAAIKDIAPAWNDVISTDALGREQSRYSPVQGTTTTSSFYDSYGQASLVRVVTAHPANLKDTTDNSYNGGGALFNVTVRREVATQALPGHPYPFFARQRIKDRYGANDKLMASETQFDTVDAVGAYGPQTYFEREEYRYDALGRRIWRRLIRPDIGICNKMDAISGCFSIVERTVWDGDQVLWEIRADGGDGATTTRMEGDGGGGVRPALEGRVFYTHGGGLDHPLSIGRMDASAGYIVPVSDWRGNAIAGYCSGTTLCTEYQWPQEAASPWDQIPPPGDGASGPTTWKGNLVDTHTDGSGLVYKRNRYYDPGSGRFTQEDPIGLAGGLNAYGFAGGDPVNYSDPLGLCAGESDKQSKANRTQANAESCSAPAKPSGGKVHFTGAVGNLFTGGGATVSAGHWHDDNEEGTYEHIAVGPGSVEISAGVERGGSTNQDAFGGKEDIGLCGGALVFGLCGAQNKAGTTITGSVTAGLIPASAHAEVWGYTLVQKSHKHDQSYECAKIGTGCQ